MVFPELVVDKVVEEQSAGEKAHVAACEGEVLGDLQRCLGEVVLVVVEVAVVEIVGILPRHLGQARTRKTLAAEQTLAGLVVGVIESGQQRHRAAALASTNIGVEIALAHQGSTLILHAQLRAERGGGVEHRLDAVLAERQLEVDGKGQPGQSQQQGTHGVRNAHLDLLSSTALFAAARRCGLAVFALVETPLPGDYQAQ